MKFIAIVSQIFDKTLQKHSLNNPLAERRFIFMEFF